MGTIFVKKRKKNLKKKVGPNLRQAKSGIFSFSVVMVWGSRIWGQKFKVAQNDLNHILVLDFLKSDEIFKFFKVATSKAALGGISMA